MWCALRRQLFDLIDIDSFGGDTSFVGLALGALRYGGLLCLTSTAGPVAAGRDPVSALSMYGMHLAPVPHANEQVEVYSALLGAASSGARARHGDSAAVGRVL
jgi:tRNA G26 N,N-dimethylase Trm1